MLMQLECTILTKAFGRKAQPSIPFPTGIEATDFDISNPSGKKQDGSASIQPHTGSETAFGKQKFFVEIRTGVQ